MSTIFDELRATQRLIEDNRKTLYSLQERGYPESENIVHDKQIVIKGLELYLDSLEGTINARSRMEAREKM